jgi:hypothetical protein
MPTLAAWNQPVPIVRRAGRDTASLEAAAKRKIPVPAGNRTLVRPVTSHLADWTVRVHPYRNTTIYFVHPYRNTIIYFVNPYRNTIMYFVHPYRNTIIYFVHRYRNTILYFVHPYRNTIIYFVHPYRNTIIYFIIFLLSKCVCSRRKVQIVLDADKLHCRFLKLVSQESKQLSPRSRIHLENTMVAQLVKKCIAF